MAGSLFRSGVCAVWTACLLAGAVLAQDTGPSETPATTTRIEGRTESATVLDTISVTATRNPIRSFEYPGMVSVVGRERILTGQPSTPDDMMRLIPNVEFIGGPRRTGEVPSIRGFDGPDVVILLDGARQNFGSAHDGRFFLDPSLVKRVEVLRGPASSLYGSGGTGGVIEFRTIDAADFLGRDETVGATVSGGYRSGNEEWRGTVTGYTRAGAGLDLVGSVVTRNSGTIHLGDGGRLENTDDDILAGLAKASFELADHQRVEGSFTAFRNDAREPNNGQGGGGALAPGIVDKDIRSNTLRLAYRYNDPADRWLDLDVVTYYSGFKADELRLDDLGAGPEGELLKRDVDTVGARLDNRSRLTLSESIGATFTYGAEWYRDEQDGAAGSGERDGVADARSAFHGLFTQAEVAFGAPGGIPGEILVIPGVRYDSYKSTRRSAGDNRDDELSPRIGVSYLPTDWFMLFANYGHAFRAPTFNEVYLTGVHFQIPLGRAAIVNRFVANPDLKPQRTRTVEFGGGLSFDSLFGSGDKLRIKTSHFQVRGRDFIDLAVHQPPVFGERGPLPQCFHPGACDGTTISSNVAKAKLSGTEVEASYESSRLYLTLGASTIDGENRDSGEKLGTLTPDTYTADMGLKLHELDSVLGLRLLAANRFEHVDSNQDRPGYAVVDTYLTWQPSGGLLKGLRVDLGVDNVFDKAYSRVYTGAYEEGRSYNVSAGYAVNW